MTRPPVERLQMGASSAGDAPTTSAQPMRLTASQLLNVLELLNGTSSTLTTTTTTTTVTTSLNNQQQHNQAAPYFQQHHATDSMHHHLQNDLSRVSVAPPPPTAQPCDHSHSYNGAASRSSSIIGPTSSRLIGSSPSAAAATSADDGSPKANGFMDRLYTLFNDKQTILGVTVPSSVRDLVAQYWLQFLLILVILIYLIYYFKKVSRRPKLIGKNDSKFVQFIRDNLKQSVENRFNPLMYFWGANAQTALFGYLQGRTSMSESERDLLIKRQYLYVSDLQYLTSNKDLSRYYEDRKQEVRIQLRATNLLEDYERSLDASYHAHDQAHDHDHDLLQTSKTNIFEEHHQQRRHENIRIALESIVSNDGQLKQNHSFGNSKLNHKNLRIIMSSTSTSEQQQQIGNSYSCPSCCSSSSDSGVFGTNSGQASTLSSSGHSSGSSRASTSSLNGPISEEGYSSSGDNSIDHSTTTMPNDNLTDDSMQNSDNQITKQTTTTINEKQQHHHTQRKSLFDVYSAKKHPNKERLEFGQCALDWFVSSHKNYHKNKLVALISAGMTTGSDKRYVTDTVKTLESLGYECCVFIRRGVGGLKLSSAKFFSPAKWRDFEAAVQSVRQQRPDAKLVGVGFSFGSIELCRYLAMSRKQSHIDAALLVSCPFDPVCGGENMHNGSYLNRRIDAYLAKNLGRQLYQAMFPSTATSPAPSESSSTLSSCIDLTAASGGAVDHGSTTNHHHQQATQSRSQLTKKPSETLKHKLSTTVDPEKKRSLKGDKLKVDKTKKCQIWTNENGSTINLAVLPKLKSLHDFEYGYNRIVQHYPSREAYAQDCELDLSTIEVPTLCLSSEDDFMAPKNLLPIDQVKANPNICMLLTKRGGHMAFVDGLVWPKKPYFAQRIISDYMGAIRNTYIDQEKQQQQMPHRHQLHHDHTEFHRNQLDKDGPSLQKPSKQQQGPHIAIDLHHHHHHHHYIHPSEDNK